MQVSKIPLVFVYYVVVDEPMANCCQFPKTYGHWSNGFQLLKPADAVLHVGKTVRFAVKVPEAKEVVVVHPIAGWTHLTRDKTQTWNGDVESGSEPGAEILLSARFSDEPNSYCKLLEFKVRQVYKLKIVLRLFFSIINSVCSS